MGLLQPKERTIDRGMPEMVVNRAVGRRRAAAIQVLSRSLPQPLHVVCTIYGAVCSTNVRGAQTEQRKIILRPNFCPADKVQVLSSHRPFNDIPLLSQGAEGEPSFKFY